MVSGGLWHIEKGDFTGHPAGLRWTHLPNSPLKMTTEQFNAVIDPMQVKNENGRYIKPENVDGAPFKTMAEAKKNYLILNFQRYGSLMVSMVFLHQNPSKFLRGI